MPRASPKCRAWTHEVIHVCAQMDAAGNTAKAITKGFAIGAAGLTVLALFAAYAETVGVTSLDLLNPIVIVGIFIGSMMPPVFSAMTHPVRGQERLQDDRRDPPPGARDPRLAGRHRRPRLRELRAHRLAGRAVGAGRPGLLAFLSPLAVGFFLGPEALGGFLGGSIFVGLIFALFMANAGGLWDNAKKYIEDGALGGPGSEEHKAAVVGDTVGDPFKDTAGPSINTLITVMSLVATVFAPIIGKYALPVVFGWF